MNLNAISVGAVLTVSFQEACSRIKNFSIRQQVAIALHSFRPMPDVDWSSTFKLSIPGQLASCPRECALGFSKEGLLKDLMNVGCLAGRTSRKQDCSYSQQVGVHQTLLMFSPLH